MRTLFFGTPELAVPTLAALVDAGHTVSRVISQPARPVGRGRQLQDPPVAAWARARGLEVMQPEKVRGRELLAELRSLEPDVAVVVAFGQIFRRRLLALPRLGCVNLHTSLLPRWRGAAPIQAAIAAGDARTGVTTMVMEEALDAGPILLQEEVAIGPDETAAELAPRLAQVGAALMVRTLDGLAAGTLTPQPQDEAFATYAPTLHRSDGEVDWRLAAGAIYNRLRAYTPWPGLASAVGGKAVKILEARPVAGGAAPAATAAAGATVPAVPGEIVAQENGRVWVACGGGSILALERVQLAGKRPVVAGDFMNGERLRVGDRFLQAAEV